MSLTVTSSLPLSETVDGSEAPTRTRRTGTLVKSEEWWRDNYHKIEMRGYKLRPRYHPLWEPSWIKSKKDFYSVEDGQATIVRCSYSIHLPELKEWRKTRAVMDAVRTRDDLPVILKRIFPEEGPYELSITRKFSSPELAGDPHNRCVPLLEVIELEGTGSHKLMVFPLLRPFDRPRFQTFGEFAAFFTQLCDVSKPTTVHRVDHAKRFDLRVSSSCMRGT
jgi:hypothetical protein